MEISMSCLSAFIRFSFQKFFLGLSALLALSIISFALQSVAQTKLPGSGSCAKFDEGFQNSNDLLAMESYRSTVRKMVEDEAFN